jgi:KTSC domain
MPSIVIAEISYDRMRARLTVTFANGRTYEYIDVPAEVVASFQSAFSKGTFFNSYIRDRYDFKELMDARLESVSAIGSRIAKRRLA